MATADERTRLQRASKQYTGGDFGTGGYDEAFERSGMSTDDRIREILNSPEAQQYAQAQAAAQYQPLIGETDRAAAETKNDLDTLISQLDKQRQEAPEQIFNDFNRRGLFRSSMAQKEVGSQVGQLVNKIGSAQVQRSTRLADLAAQRAGLLSKQTQYEIGFRDQNRNQFEDDAAARLKMEEERRQQEEALKRQLASSRQQQSWMDMFAQQNQPQVAPEFSEEELPGLPEATSQPTPQVQSSGPSALQNFTQPRSLQEQGSYIKNLFGGALNKVSNTKVPAGLRGARSIFGENLFRRG